MKLPDLGRMIPALRFFFQNDSVIFNLRHPVLNIASIIEPNYDRGWSFEKIVVWYKCFFPPELLNGLISDIHFTRYEDLFMNTTEQAGGRMLEILGLNPDLLPKGSNFTYPNAKVMRKTQGTIDKNRMTKSFHLLSPEQFAYAASETKDIADKYYSDLTLDMIFEETKGTSQ